MDVVHTKTTFDTKAIVVSWPIATFYANNFFIFNVVCDLTTYTAEWTNRIHLAIDGLRTNQTFWHERTSWASLHALTTSNASTVTHWIIQVKDDFTMSATHCVTDHIVYLLFAASTHTAITLNTRI